MRFVIRKKKKGGDDLDERGKEKEFIPKQEGSWVHDFMRGDGKWEGKTNKGSYLLRKKRVEKVHHDAEKNEKEGEGAVLLEKKEKKKKKEEPDSHPFKERHRFWGG